MHNSNLREKVWYFVVARLAMEIIGAGDFQVYIALSSHNKHIRQLRSAHNFPSFSLLKAYGNGRPRVHSCQIPQDLDYQIDLVLVVSMHT
jgi:hypothetical protein